MGIGPRAQPPAAKRAGRLWGQNVEDLESFWKVLGRVLNFSIILLCFI